MLLTYANIVLCGWVLYFLIVTALVYRPRPIAMEPPRRDQAPRIAVLLPVRGYGPGAVGFVDCLVAQDYPNFRVLLLVESSSDPACRLLLRPGMAERATLVVAGETQLGAQKVANVLAGLRKLTLQDEIVVFCDADSCPPAGWLTRLTAPIRNGEVAVTTGYRLLIPKTPRPGSWNASAIETPLALAPRPPIGPLHCWGGSTAILARCLPRLDLETRLRGRFNEDLVLSRAIKEAKLKGRFLRDQLLPSYVDFSWSGHKRYLLRQMLHFRHYMALAGIGLVFCMVAPLLFWGGAIVRAIDGSVLAVYAMIAVFLLDGLRAWLRRDAIRRLIGPQAARQWTCAALAGWLLVIPRALLIVAGFIACYRMKEVSWAGIDYRIRAPHDVQVIARRPPADGEEEQRDLVVAAAVGAAEHQLR